MMIKFIIFVFVCFVFRIARENAASNQYVFFIVNLPSKRDLTLSVIVTARLKTLDCAFGRTKSQKCKQIRHLASSCYGLTTSNAMNSDNDSTCVLFSIEVAQHGGFVYNFDFFSTSASEMRDPVFMRSVVYLDFIIKTPL